MVLYQTNEDEGGYSLYDDSYERLSGRKTFNERRRQVDWVVKAASALSVTAWLVAVASVLLLDIAAPARTDFFSNVFGGQVSTAWNVAILRVILFLLFLSLCACVVAFIFNMSRMRRKTDKYRKSVIIMGATSFIGIIIFLSRFAPHIF